MGISWRREECAVDVPVPVPVYTLLARLAVPPPPSGVRAPGQGGDEPPGTGIGRERVESGAVSVDGARECCCCEGG